MQNFTQANVVALIVQVLDKNIKCTCYNNHTYMHSYCSNCAWMHNFTTTDVGVFLTKMCKRSSLFYFAKFYTIWYGCFVTISIMNCLSSATNWSHHFLSKIQIISINHKTFDITKLCSNNQWCGTFLELVVYS